MSSYVVIFFSVTQQFSCSRKRACLQPHLRSITCSKMTFSLSSAACAVTVVFTILTIPFPCEGKLYCCTSAGAVIVLLLPSSRHSSIKVYLCRLLEYPLYSLTPLLCKFSLTLYRSLFSLPVFLTSRHV